MIDSCFYDLPETEYKLVQYDHGKKSTYTPVCLNLSLEVKTFENISNNQMFWSALSFATLQSVLA